jgi:hypothetical protein
LFISKTSFFLFWNVEISNLLVIMIPHRSHQSGGVPSSLVSIPSTSTHSLYMGNRSRPGGLQGSSSIPQITPALQQSGASSFVPGSNLGFQSDMALQTGLPPYPVSAIASSPIQVPPPIPSKLYYPSSQHHAAYGFGPPYFQDPFVSLGQCPSYNMVPPTPVAGNLPHQYFTPRVTSPVLEDDTSTIVTNTNGVPMSVLQDIMSQGCQVSFNHAMSVNDSSVPQVSAGCQVS